MAFGGSDAKVRIIRTAHVEALTHKEDILLASEEFESIELGVIPSTKGTVYTCAMPLGT